jgi:hypothetical protein
MKLIFDNISIAVDTELDRNGNQIYRAYAYDSDGMNIAIAKDEIESNAITSLFSTMRDDAQEIVKNAL